MKIIRKLAVAVAAAAALALPSVARAPEADIVDVAVGAGSFKTLVELVQQAGLVDVLKSKGPFTVFAPTDDAFKKVPKATLEALGKDKNLLKRVLTYHVVSGNVTAADVVKLKNAKTVAGAQVKIKVKNGKVMINDSNVVKTDIMASNGVIHVIDTVLLPPAPKKGH
ncbi:MAG TPA: fasciclin domain-containing protein [Fimbriimonadaceae bacterium]|nr:fasciclin domain-containing protein [Fimbriimonadaceae bacterium]